MRIPVSHGKLEAALREPPGELRGGAVLCHPHPLHGGTMHTKAVYRAAQALAGVGVRTLRFNFRGVGVSTGSHDGGIGEEEDVGAALDWIARETPGSPLLAGGLSFGSLVALRVGAQDSRVAALVAMGAPVHVYDYSFLARVPKPVLVVQGEKDRFGTGPEVRELLGALGDHVHLRVIRGSGHLFEGHYRELQEAIREYFTLGSGGAVLAAASGKEREGGP